MAKEKPAPRKRAKKAAEDKPPDAVPPVQQQQATPPAAPQPPPVIINNTYNPQSTNSNVNENRADTNATSETKAESSADANSALTNSPAASDTKVSGTVKAAIITGICTVIAAVAPWGPSFWKGAIQEAKKPEPPRYEGAMDVFFASRDAAGALHSPGRIAFYDQNEGSIVKWDGYIQKGYDDGGYSVSLQKGGEGKALVRFKSGKSTQRFIPKGSHISFEGIIRGDLSDGRVSIEDARLLKILAAP